MESKLKNDPNINIDIDYDKIKLDLTNGPKVSSVYSLERVGVPSARPELSASKGLSNIGQINFDDFEKPKKTVKQNNTVKPNSNSLISNRFASLPIDSDEDKKKYLKYKQKYLNLKSKM